MPKRKGSARTGAASEALHRQRAAAAASAAADNAGEDNEPMLEANEPAATRLDSMPDTEESFDVAGFGEIPVGMRDLYQSLNGANVRVRESS